MKTGQLDRAIMQNTTLVTKYPDSIYSYGAYKNLLYVRKKNPSFRKAEVDSLIAVLEN